MHLGGGACAAQRRAALQPLASLEPNGECIQGVGFVIGTHAFLSSHEFPSPESLQGVHMAMHGAAKYLVFLLDAPVPLRAPPRVPPTPPAQAQSQLESDRVSAESRALQLQDEMVKLQEKLNGMLVQRDVGDVRASRAGRKCRQQAGWEGFHGGRPVPMMGRPSAPDRLEPARAQSGWALTW